ncbi:MAG TPA: hypothetical protein VFG59_08960 [Anaeromyxobacter sp.]|nr:hypothetical protein [Anaeromyxobacter sp.]
MISLAAALSLLALAQAGPSGAPAGTSAEQRSPVPSLLSAETLEGRSLLEASAGWPRLRLAYGQGLTPQTDLGAFGDFNYSTTELIAGATYRGAVLPRVAPFAGALRVSLGWYHDFGGHWIYHHRNHFDNGVAADLGVSYSRFAGGGELSLLGDLPVIVTFRKGGGLLVNPRAALAYQTPFYGPYTIGIQLGLGLRVGLGDAPVKRGTGEITALVVAGYRI